MEVTQQSKPLFQDTTATRKIFSLKKRIRAVAGGTSASKTISIIVWLIDYCQTRQKHTKLVSVVSESHPHLEKGAILDFQNIMKSCGYWKEELWHDTKHTYTFETGNKLEFYSVDTYGKAHGPRRDVLFINECNNLEYKIVDQLITRTREVVWMDWNPSQEFWFYTEMMPNRTDIDFITLTYKDNEALDSVTIAEIESHKNNKAWWQVYGLGQLGEVETRIYKGWNISLDEIPYGAELKRRGLDFGYSNDPTAIIDIYSYDGGYILDEVLYQKGMLNKQIADTINVQDERCLVIADSSEPKSIDEIRLYGVNIQGALKGPGSLLKGINFVQSKKISVTSRSTNIIKEYRNYVWETDDTGKVLNEPMDLNNHCFIGNSLVTTEDGTKQICDIKVGDYVLTSRGMKPVVLKHNNGIKTVSEYWLQLDTNRIKVVCTDEHRIRTDDTWTPISQLKPGMMVYHTKHSIKGNTISITKKDISHPQIEECTLKSGNTFMEKYLKDFMSTIKIKTPKTIDQIIYNWYQNTSIFPNMVKSVLEKIKYSLYLSKRKVLMHLNLGMEVQMAVSGTNSMLNNPGNQEVTQNSHVFNAVRNSSHDIRESSNIAITTAKLVHLEKGESWQEQVYDLTVEDSHEYFVNGILVHNCMDALRYAMNSLNIGSDVAHQFRPQGMSARRGYKVRK